MAAESTRQGGGFAENRDSEPLKVKGANSTFNTTDTSAADMLPPAANAASRTDPNENYIQLGKGTKGDHSMDELQDKSISGQQSTSEKQEPITSKDTIPSRGHDASEQSTGKNQSSGHKSGEDAAEKQAGSGHKGSEQADGKGSASGHGSSGRDAGNITGKKTESGQPEDAPTYVEVDVINPPINPKPKGANLTEGGFDSDNAQNASTNAEIGSEDDPGRAAEAQFQKATAHTAADSAGSGMKQKGITDDGQFDALPAEEEA